MGVEEMLAVKMQHGATQHSAQRVAQHSMCRVAAASTAQHVRRRAAARPAAVFTTTGGRAAPQPPLPLQTGELKDARALAYDLVYNGVEIGGGSLRIYR